MLYYLYMITNMLDRNIYIGAHQTKDLNDDYFGSGIYLRRAIKKYGKENFKKTIFEFCNSKKEMYESERIIVNENFVARKDTYNIAIGGEGGFICPASKEAKLKMSINHADFSGEKNGFFGKHHAEETKLKMRKNRKDVSGENNAFYGRHHTEETKAKIKKSWIERKRKLKCQTLQA